jgi:4-amino-4-deoxy-L-arabinose transferase-like glycosyltransferase
VKKYFPYILILFSGGLFFIPLTGNVNLFDWDEVNFAEIAREMIVTGDWLKVQVNYSPFYEKPPLFFWLQAISMKVFGMNEFAARFPNAVVGILTLMVLYGIGSRLFNARFGSIWVMAFFGSILPHMYFKSGIIDPLFNLFIFLGIYFFLKHRWNKDSPEYPGSGKPQSVYFLSSGLFIGLALLTKGPVACLILALTFIIYWLSHRGRKLTTLFQFFFLTLIAFVVMFTWLGLETLHHGTSFIKEFLVYQIRLFTTHDAGHAGFPGFHVIVLLFGCFPASVFAIRGFYKINSANQVQVDFRKWMIILFFVVLALFSVVQSKIIHYSSLAYFPLTFIAAIVIRDIIDGNIMFTNLFRFGLISISSVIILLCCASPFIGRNIDLISPFFSNNIDALSSLEADVRWTGWEFLPGLIMLITLMLFFFYKAKKYLVTAFWLLFSGTAVMVFTGLIFFAGRAEMYTQNANVEFCKRLQGSDCYIKTSGFKSYIPYFYSKRLPQVNEKSDDIGWLTWEPVDKEVYIIAKSHLREYWAGVPTVEIISEKNGFLFVKRKRN